MRFVSCELLTTQCEFVVHHSGSGVFGVCCRLAAPQVPVPFMFDQFFWSEKVQWLGVGSAPLPLAKLMPALDVETHGAVAYNDAQVWACGYYTRNSERTQVYFPSVVFISWVAFCCYCHRCYCCCQSYSCRGDNPVLLYVVIAVVVVVS